jgi:hypothetical protein
VDVKRVWGPLLLAAALVLIAVVGYWQQRPAEAISVSCPDPVAGCHFMHAGVPASIRFSAQPKPLEAFSLSVHAAGTRKASAEFQMVGMDMGFNRYDLRPGKTGEFAANVTLPVCVSGDHRWMLYLEIDGTRYAVPFSTR